MIEKYIALLPKEIQYHILKYTYKKQPKHLLEDIYSFTDDKITINGLYICYFESLCSYLLHHNHSVAFFSGDLCKTDWFYKDLLQFCKMGYSTDLSQTNYPLFILFMRNLRICNKVSAYKYYTKIFNYKTQKAKISLLWGLLNPVERKNCVYYLRDEVQSRINELESINVLTV
jgi:hypothetical protein